MALKISAPVAAGEDGSRSANVEASSSGDQYVVEVGGDCDEPEWDRFVAGCRDPHPEQTSWWGAAQRLRGWFPIRILVRRSGRLVGGAQILERPAGRIGRVGYLNRGPLAVIEDCSLRSLILRALQDLGRSRKLGYLSVVLPYDSGVDWLPHLRQEGFAISPRILPPQTSMRATIVVDLHSDLDQLLARMRRTTRRYLKQGLNRGLRFRQGGAEDLDTFSKLVGELCRRRGVPPNIPLGDFVHAVWRGASADSLARLFLTEYQQEAVGALMVFTMGGWARAWRIGWSGRHEHLRPNELIYWEAIKWAKSNGCQHFEIAGFGTKNAEALAEGREISKSEWCGMSFFKLGFGGRVLPLQPGYCYLYHPVLRALFNLAGRQVLGSRFGEFLARKAMASMRHL